MEEMEHNLLPAEPEEIRPETAEEEISTAEEETAPVEETPAPAEEIPAPQPVQPPRRRSPYENSPYLMYNQTPPAEPVQVEEVAEEKPVKERKKRPVLRAVWQVFIFALLAFSIAFMVSGLRQQNYVMQIQALEEQIDVLRDQLEQKDHITEGNSVSGTPNVGISGMTPGQVYAQNLQSVVLIETDVATGTGFVLTADGYVVTNYHVVEKGTAIRVVMYDQHYYEARLVGYEANNDVALLKIEGEFRPVTLGSSDDLIVGDQVAAIGNPLGELTSTLTVGYVSAKGRDVSTDSATINMIQTDCAINSGNSGGPLFNMKGEVVGITTAKYSGTSSSGASIEGIGFAVPMDDVVGILEDLMEFGYVKSGYLGVSVYTVSPAETVDYNIPLGCRVADVTPGSCAAKAGLKAADIIIGLGGYEIQGYTDLARVLREFEGGEETTITVYRGGQELTFPIILDAKPTEQAVPQPGGDMPENGSYEEWYNYFFGQ